MEACLSHPEQNHSSSMAGRTAFKPKKWISEDQVRGSDSFFNTNGPLMDLGHANILFV